MVLRRGGSGEWDRLCGQCIGSLAWNAIQSGI